jgi:hypothetical protein
VPDPHNHMVLMLVNLQGAAVIFRVDRHHHRVDHSVKVGASHTPSQTPLPLRSRSPTPQTSVTLHPPPRVNGFALF